MSVAKLFPYRDTSGGLLFRGKTGHADGSTQKVSKFYPCRVGNALLLRGMDTTGKIKYGYTYRESSGRLMGRTLFEPPGDDTYQYGNTYASGCFGCTNHYTTHARVRGDLEFDWECATDCTASAQYWRRFWRTSSPFERWMGKNTGTIPPSDCRWDDYFNVPTEWSTTAIHRHTKRYNLFSCTTNLDENVVENYVGIMGVNGVLSGSNYVWTFTFHIEFTTFPRNMCGDGVYPYLVSTYTTANPCPDSLTFNTFTFVPTPWTGTYAAKVNNFVSHPIIVDWPTTKPFV